MQIWLQSLSHEIFQPHAICLDIIVSTQYLLKVFVLSWSSKKFYLPVVYTTVIKSISLFSLDMPAQSAQVLYFKSNRMLIISLPQWGSIYSSTTHLAPEQFLGWPQEPPPILVAEKWDGHFLQFAITKHKNYGAKSKAGLLCLKAKPMPSLWNQRKCHLSRHLNFV